MENLKEFLHSAAIPKQQGWEQTIFDVMRQPHLENVWSNIYAFFLDPNERHGLGELFLNSLVELINNQEVESILNSDVSVRTEVITDEGKRIDISITSPNHAIIIENKVYASLYNNLELYWEHYSPQIQKQGVVLSLHRVRIPKEKDKDVGDWTNITHLELLEQVQKNINNYSSGADATSLVLYNQFYQNVKNQTNAMNEESIKFYLENVEKVEEIGVIRNNFRDIVIKGIKNPTGKLEGYSTNENKYAQCVYIFKEEDDRDQLMYTVDYQNVFTADKTLQVKVEVKNEFLEKCIGIFDFAHINTGEKWAHVALSEPKELKADDILNISKTVADMTAKLEQVYGELKKFKKNGRM